MITATTKTTLREALLRDIRTAVVGVDPDAEVVLFGSRARGDAREDSDWDLLMLPSREIDLKLRDAFNTAIYDVELAYFEALSMVFFPLSRWRAGHTPAPLYDNIRREGIWLMTKEERDLFVRHKLEKAEEALDEVSVLYDMQHYGTAASRLYYAAFYGASALLASHGHVTKTHSGIKTQLSKVFVSTEILTKAQGRLFRKLFDLRQLGDYGEVLDVSQEQLDEVRDAGVALVRQLIRLTP